MQAPASGFGRERRGVRQPMIAGARPRTLVNGGCRLEKLGPAARAESGVPIFDDISALAARSGRAGRGRCLTRGSPAFGRTGRFRGGRRVGAGRRPASRAFRTMGLAGGPAAGRAEDRALVAQNGFAGRALGERTQDAEPLPASVAGQNAIGTNDVVLRAFIK